MPSRDETRDLIGRYFDAFNAHSIEGMLACLSDEVVHDVNEGGRRIGKDAFEQFAIHMAQSYRETLSDMVIMVSEDGGRAAAEYTVHGTYLTTDEGLPPANGQSYSLPAGSFFEVDDGLISRVTTYYNLKAWIEQVSGR